MGTPRRSFSNAPKTIPWPVLGWALACVGVLMQSGCMTAITTAALRESLRDTAGRTTDGNELPEDCEEKEEPPETAGQTITDRPSRSSVDNTTAHTQTAARDPIPQSLDAALDQAIGRLAGVGGFDSVAQATLVATLESTRAEDWPFVIEAFATSLEANRPRAVHAKQQTVLKSVNTVASFTAGDIASTPLKFPEPAETQLAVPEPSPAHASDETKIVQAAQPVPSPDADAAMATSATAASSHQPQGERIAIEAISEGSVALPERHSKGSPTALIEPATQPSLAVHNPCFASRVRAWGVVDAFEQHTFQPGQELIVYFELEELSSRESTAGHSTRIDTVFRLVGADGARLGQWSFEPIEETCRSPRRDYFARYFLRIPTDAPAGSCQLEFVVTDTLTGISTQAHLDLDIVRGQ